ncbi:MAG: hypothetical protein ABSC51_03895 [Gaiellaceae bacterium]
MSERRLLKLSGTETDTGGMHTVLWLAKRFGIGQQRVGGVGLLLVVVVGVPAFVLLYVKYLT